MASEQLDKLDEEIKKEMDKDSINSNADNISNKIGNNISSGISSVSSKIEGFGNNIGNKISSAISNKLPDKITNNFQKSSDPSRRHANFNLLVLVIFVSAVFLAAAFIYHFQLSFFYNKLVDKDAELDDMESKLTTHLSRFEESQGELSAKAQYEQDLINKYSETQETSESLEGQIKVFSETVVQRQNRLITEVKTFQACDTQRDELLAENTELKDDLLEVVDERNDRKVECIDECGGESQCA